MELLKVADHNFIQGFVKRALEVQRKKKKPYLPYLPMAGAAAGAALPAASLGQYMLQDYPKYRNTLLKTPIYETLNKMPIKLQAGDLFAGLDDPVDTSISCQGTNFSGTPAYHAGIVWDPKEAPNNAEKSVIEGGWLPPAGVESSKLQGLMSPHWLEQVYDTYNTANESLPEPEPTVLGKIKDIYHTIKKMPEVWEGRGAEQAKIRQSINDMLSQNPQNQRKILWEQMKDTKDFSGPTLVVRPNVPNLNPAKTNQLLETNAVKSYGVPYSELEAVKAALKRVVAPIHTPAADVPSYQAPDKQFDYCVTPACDFMKGLGAPIANRSQTLPADVFRTEHTTPLGIFANSGNVTSKEPFDPDKTRSTILKWLEDAKLRRVGIGLGATAALGGVGYLGAKGIQKLLALRREKKRREAEAVS